MSKYPTTLLPNETRPIKTDYILYPLIIEIYIKLFTILVYLLVFYILFLSYVFFYCKIYWEKIIKIKLFYYLLKQELDIKIITQVVRYIFGSLLIKKLKNFDL